MQGVTFLLVSKSEEAEREQKNSKMEKLPIILLSEEILRRLDLDSLCTAACVNRYLRSVVYTQVLPSLSSLHLPSPGDAQTLRCITRVAVAAATDMLALHHLTLNCQRLQYTSIVCFLVHAPRIQRLHLFGCSNLPGPFLSSIGVRCSFLTELVLELTQPSSSLSFRTNLAYMLTNCNLLEYLDIKFEEIFVDASALCSIEFFLPKTIKVLKLRPMLVKHAIPLITYLGIGFSLHCLSLVLDMISDTLLFTITKSLPLLVELHLEDKPVNLLSHVTDLSNSGLQSLCSCRRLTSLSLIRGRHCLQQVFGRVNDMGMFLLSEACKGLQSVRFCGFCKVTDAGYALLLNSCQQLETFEVHEGRLLSDLAFHNISGAARSLAEVRLVSCDLITSEAVKSLCSASGLQVLDLSSCKSITDSCLSSISFLQRLTTLNLTEADITDAGLSVIGQCSPPITHLCLKGCKRVTDRGISLLLPGGGTIWQTLSVLELGYILGISDRGIRIIAAAGREITHLSIRYCFHVTDVSVMELAFKRRVEDGMKPLSHLDLCNCIALSPHALTLLQRPFFPRLRWVGIGRTPLAGMGDAVITKIYEERPQLTVCLDGCELGCVYGW